MAKETLDALKLAEEKARKSIEQAKLDGKEKVDGATKEREEIFEELKKTVLKKADDQKILEQNAVQEIEKSTKDNCMKLVSDLNGNYESNKEQAIKSIIAEII